MTLHRVALVTGAARGQGAAIVQRLHEDGFRVAACDLLADELNATRRRTRRRRCDARFALDVTSERAVGGRGQRDGRRFGSLTTLVNNAGVLHRASLADETPAGFERVGGSTASARFSASGPHSTPAARRRRRDRQHLQHRRHPAFPNHAAYGSSKWALRGLTQIAAAELAPAGIRVNAVFPGPIETPMLDDATQTRLAACLSAGSARRSKWPTPWRSWCQTTRRSSPAPNSSWTEANACKSDERAERTSSVPAARGSSAPAPGAWRSGSSCEKRAFATSRSSTARTASAGHGGSTPIRGLPAT